MGGGEVRVLICQGRVVCGVRDVTLYEGAWGKGECEVNAWRVGRQDKRAVLARLAPAKMSPVVSLRHKTRGQLRGERADHPPHPLPRRVCDGCLGVALRARPAALSLCVWGRGTRYHSLSL
jgi:hypothetical protein